MGRRVAFPAIAALLLIGAPWLTWWTATEGSGELEMTMRASLYDATGCVREACMPVGPVPGAWHVIGLVALAILTATGIAAGVAATRALADRGTDEIMRWVGIGGRAALAVTIGALGYAVGGKSGVPSLGGALAAAGAVLAMVAAAEHGTADGFGDARSRVPVRVAPVARVPRTPGGGEIRSLADLRFVVKTGTLVEGGLTVELASGARRTIAWTDVTEVVVRRLPPDPPFEKTAICDLVTGAGPLRLLPTSRIDFASLPRGAAPSTKENWRRLVEVARAANPAIAIERESAAFFAGGEAPIVAAIKRFAEYDRRYT